MGYYSRNMLYLLWALPWMFLGLAFMATIVGIPFGLALWRVGSAPFIRQANRKAKKEHDYVYGQIADHADVWRPLTQEDIQEAIDRTPKVTWHDPGLDDILKRNYIDYDQIGKDEFE